MTELQFRLLLCIFIAILVVHIIYDPDRAVSAKRPDWMRELPRYKLVLLAAVLLGVIVAGIVGLIGMFFFQRWATITFLFASAIVEVSMPPGKHRNVAEKTLGYSVIGGEVLFFYLIFFGPARPLFS